MTRTSVPRYPSASSPFPPNADSGDHTHGAIEMFYVLSGQLEHVVNGKSYVLGPG